MSDIDAAPAPPARPGPGTDHARRPDRPHPGGSRPPRARRRDRTLRARTGRARAQDDRESLRRRAWSTRPPSCSPARGRVWIRKRCDAHGLARRGHRERRALLPSLEQGHLRAPLWRGAHVRHPSPSRSQRSACCADGGSCGDGTDQSSNKTCTVLVEVTERVQPRVSRLLQRREGRSEDAARGRSSGTWTQLIAKKGGLDSVQLTGGEALLAPGVLGDGLVPPRAAEGREDLPAHERLAPGARRRGEAAPAIQGSSDGPAAVRQRDRRR